MENLFPVHDRSSLSQGCQTLEFPTDRSGGARASSSQKRSSESTLQASSYQNVLRAHPFFFHFLFFIILHRVNSSKHRDEIAESRLARTRGLDTKGTDRKILSVGGCHPSYTSKRLYGGVSMVSSDVYTTNERVREDEGTNVTKRRYFIEGARRPDRR